MPQSDNDIIRTWLLSDSLNFTRYFFKEISGSANFIVGQHHRLICDKLNDVLKGKCKRLIINISPRYGKCIAPNTRILTQRGLVAAKDIIIGDMVMSFGDGNAIWKPCIGTDRAHKESVKIKMRSGREFICSSDHPMLTTFGYHEAAKLNVGDRIQALSCKYNGFYEIDDAELDFISLMIFEGCCTKHLHFSNADENIIDLMKATCIKLGFELCHRPSDNYCDFGFKNKPLVRRILEKYGVSGHLSYDKRIPAKWFVLTTRQRLRFLDLMFATDGYVCKNGQSGITLANKGLIEDIQAMLASVGIISSIRYKHNKCKGAWALTIPRRDTIKLLSMITFMQKKEKAEYVLQKKPVCITDSFPYEIIRKEHLTYVTSKPPFRCCPSKEITRDKFIKLSESIPALKKYICQDFYLDRVESIEQVGVMDLIDIEVADTHNFVGNGLVSHNTELAVKNFIAMGLAMNPKSRFIHLSYSDTLVQDNSAAVKDIVKSEKYQELFNISVRANNDTKKQWSVVQGGGMYATSTLGQITGFGAGAVDVPGQPYKFAGAVIIDDPIKPEDALSDNEREKVNRRFETTIRNRVNSRNTPIIIIMQRLHENDLCGYLQRIEPNEWEVLSIPCLYLDKEGKEAALWPFKHTVEELYQIRNANSYVFETQYMQDPKPIEGLMYAQFRTYSHLPLCEKIIRRNYTDTADTGADYLCSICYAETKTAMYITDVLFTKRPMEYTEPATADMLLRNRTEQVMIESNNGGRSFARAVEQIIREDRSVVAKRMAFKTFTQTGNKEVRIFSRSAEVQNLIYFPEGWELRWTEFANAIKAFRKEGRNQHDDAPDVLSGMCENFGSGYNTISDNELINDFL